MDDDDPLELDLDEGPGHFADYRSPEVLAPAGFALALASLFGYGLLSGSFVFALAADADGAASTQAQVLAGLVGAALAFLPLLLGLEAVRHLLEDDPLWVSALARATVLLGAVVVALRLVHTLAAALSDSTQYFGY